MSETPLLSVEQLACYFDVSASLLNRLLERKKHNVLKAVDGVDFKIPKGRTFALVGESGCGKSTVARLVVGLLKPSRGVIKFDGIDITRLRTRKARVPIQRRMQMIFQDPYASLNPRWRISKIVAEPIRAFRLANGRGAISERVRQLLVQVGLSPDDGNKYPHEFSGGQRQRISIARALASNPEFLICDEPTSSLDMSVQAQIVNLMKDLQCTIGLTYLFISHNLALVHHMADAIGVMYLGRLCEVADSQTVFSSPRHPYTRLLLNALPDMEMSGLERAPLAGEVPNPINPPSGCSFHPRCPFSNKRCKAERPEPEVLKDGSIVACHAVEEGRIVYAEIPVRYLQSTKQHISKSRAS